MTVETSNYGATVSPEANSHESFSIIDETVGDANIFKLGTRSSKTGLFGCCATSKGSSNTEARWVRIIITSLFVFAFSVTTALIIQIITDNDPKPHYVGHTVSDYSACSSVGDDVLNSGGNAVDAAITASFCLTLAAPHTTGLGGGGLMLIHKRRQNVTKIIDFREMAPTNIDLAQRYFSDSKLDPHALASIAVPGFVAGMNYALEKYGSGNPKCCTWEKLIQKAISIADDLTPTSSLINASDTKVQPESLVSDEHKNLRDFLKGTRERHHLTDDTLLHEISIFQKLVQTLRTLAERGSDDFYHGNLAGNIVGELRHVLSLEDLKSYEVVEREPLETSVGNFRVIVPPSPSSGPKLIAFLKAMEIYVTKHDPQSDDLQFLSNTSILLSKMDQLQMQLGDPGNSSEVEIRTQSFLQIRNIIRLLDDIKDVSLSEPVPSQSIQDTTSAHAAAMDVEDNYVTVVSSLNSWFGSRVMLSNGILMNNAMSAFSVPRFQTGDPAYKTFNQMAPLKRPLTKSVVALAYDKTNICGQRYLVGGASADSVGEVLTDTILFDHNLQSAIEKGRISVRNDITFIEDAFEGYPQEVIERLKHSLSTQVQLPRLPYTTVNGIDKLIDQVIAVPDARSGGYHPS